MANEPRNSPEAIRVSPTSVFLLPAEGRRKIPLENCREFLDPTLMNRYQKAFCSDLLQFTAFFALVTSAAIFILTGAACFLAFMLMFR